MKDRVAHHRASAARRTITRSHDAHAASQAAHRATLDWMDGKRDDRPVHEHLDAADAHDLAAVAHETSGNDGRAETHRAVAAEHRASAAQNAAWDDARKKP